MWICVGCQKGDQPIHHLLLDKLIHAWGSHFKKKVEKLQMLQGRALMKRESGS